MKRLKIGLNGFGRIGRIASRIILKNPNLQLVALNSRADVSSHAYLLKYDSTYGVFDLEVNTENGAILAGSDKIDVYNFSEPQEIPWEKSGVDLVIDATGKFRTRPDLEGHLKNSVKHIVLSSPAKDDIKTIVLGVNHKNFDPQKDKIVSNSSCTTNCLATVVKVVHDNYGIKRAFMTTTHAVTDSQNLLDNSHKKEVRLRRASFASMIPTTTGSAKDIVKLYPILNGKIIARAIRVPVATVSMINLVTEVEKNVDKNALTASFIKAESTYLKSILKVATEELVSVDYKGSSFSSIYDHYLTDVIGDNLVNLYAWYDNEWGYSSRLADLCEYIGKESGII